MLWVAIVAAILGFFWAVRTVLLPFLVAWLIAVLLEPVVRKLRLKGMQRAPAVFFITGVFFLITGTLIVLAIPRMTAQGSELRTQVQGLVDRLAQESATDNPFLRWNPVAKAQPPGPLAFVDNILEQGRPLLEVAGQPTTRRGLLQQYVEPYREEIAKGIQGFFNGFIGIVGAAASQVFLYAFVPLFVLFILLDLENFRVRMRTWIPNSIRASTISVLTDVGDVFKRYLRGILLNITIYGAVVTVVFVAMGAPYAFLMALLAAALYLIPILGGLIATITLIVITGLSGVNQIYGFTLPSSWHFAILLALVFFVINVTWDTLVTPRVVGKAVDLHPLVAMFVVFSGGALFGLPGMMIAYPLAGSIKVTLNRLLRVANAPNQEALALPAVPLRHRSS